jgi:hypothetical protein
LTASRKKILYILSATAFTLLLLFYFLTYYPIGTFKYSKQNNHDLDIEIKVTEDLRGYIDVDYNMDVKISFNGKLYTKSYTTSGDEITFQLLNNKGKECIVIHDDWRGDCKCLDGSCGDFFSLEPKPYVPAERNNGITYFSNYADSIKGDTLSSIVFANLRFKKIQ